MTVRGVLLRLLGGVPRPPDTVPEPTGDPPEEARAPRGTTPALQNPFEKRNAQTLSALRWLVGVLAAVASVMVAGSTLSTMGRLDLVDDRVRLTVAALSASVAVALVVVAAGLLTWAQMPGDVVDVSRLRRIADEETTEGSPVLRVVAADSSFHRGTSGLGELLERTGRATDEYYAAASRLVDARLALLGASSANDRAAAEAAVARAQGETEVLGELLQHYRVGLMVTSQLDAHLHLEARVRRAAGLVLPIATLVALCLVVFAWAANPPADGEGSADAAARAAVHVAAVVGPDPAGD